MLETFEALDHALLLKINGGHHPVLDELMWLASKTWPTVALVLLAGVFFYRRYKLRTLAFLLGCAVVSGATDLSANAVKHGVKRFRPTHHLETGAKVRVLNNYRGGRYGFVSGHAANTFGVTTFVFLCMRWVAKKWRLLFFIYPLLVVYSRVYLGVHYPSDVLFGSIHGVIFGWLGYLVMKAYFLNDEESDRFRRAGA